MRGSAEYYLDLSAIPLSELYATFFEGNIAPGRKILFERKDERRRTLESHGIETVATLIEALKTPARLAALAKQCEIDHEYLTILARQARSYRPAPVALARLGAGDDPTPGELAVHGIKNSRHLYDAVARMGSLEALATATGVSRELLDEYAALADLVRVPGIGPVFARLFLGIGVRSVAELVKSDPSDLASRLAKHVEEVGYDGPQATEWDIAFCVAFVRKLCGYDTLPT
jgi:hypothetical protein